MPTRNLTKNDMPMKTLLKKLCLAAVCLLAANTATAYDFEYEGCYFNVISETDKTCEITYKEYSKPTYSGDFIIPELVKDDEGIIYKVTTIDVWAFYNCKSLTSVTIPESVTTIYDLAFEYCTKLTSVTIPASVTTIGACAFSNCQNLKEITVDENNNNFATLDRLLYSKDISTLYWCPMDVTSVALPASVTTIGEGAFYCCGNLTSINIPTSVTSLESEAFRNCYRLKEIKIPSSVTTIKYNVFEYCTRLTELVIPSSVELMGTWLARGCRNLKFYIEDGFIPIEITSGGYVGNNFKELYIGRSVIADRSYGDTPFIDDDTGLEKVTFSQFVTSVDDIGMYNVKDLKTVVVRGRTPPTIADDFFSFDQYNNATLYVPEGTTDTYTKATGWRYFYNIVEGMPTGVSQVESPAKTTVTAGDGCIMVSNAKGAIQVYTPAGTLVKSATASGDAEITVPGHGVYIVKTGGETVKVSL